MMNAQTISVKDARNRISELIETVAIAKRTYIITKFGKAKAKIVPIDRDVSKKFGLSSAFGLWKDRKDIKDSGRWVAKMRAEWSKRYEHS